jgi:hypothetical protein
MPTFTFVPRASRKRLTSAVGAKSTMSALLATAGLIVQLLASAWGIEGGAPSGAEGSGAGAPRWLSELTPLGPRPVSEMPPVKVRYQASWSNFLTAGNIEVTLLPAIGKEAAFLTGYARAKSVGGARLLWPYDSETRALTWRKTLLPSRFEHVQTERGVKAEYVAEFRDGLMSVESAVTPKNGRSVEKERRVYKFDEIRDLLSAMRYLRETELRDGEEIKILMQPFDRLYLVSFTVLDRERRKVFSETWDTVKLDIKIRKVEDDLKLAPYTKMRRATIWLSDDEYRLPLEMHAHMFIGFVSLRMIERASP